MDHTLLPADPELRALYLAVDVGHAVELFKASTVGRYLLQRAAEERIDALADLVDVAPNDVEAIRALQSTIKRADNIEYWLEEAIAHAINARDQLAAIDKDEQK